MFCLLLGLSGCIIAPAATTHKTTLSDQWVTSVGVSDSGKRVKVKYALDYSGNVATYQGVYVWDGYGWQYASSGHDSEGYYVNYMGSQYYF